MPAASRRARHALAELVAQHDRLRLHMDDCEELADALDAQPDGDPGPLTRMVGELRVAFELHNEFEEELLRPLLASRDPHAGVRVERMVEDHVHEHAAIRARLGSPATAAVREVLETLRAHLDAEERYLVTPQVLRDDEPRPA